MGEFTLKSLLEHLRACGIHFEDLKVDDQAFQGLASLEQADSTHISFLANPKYVKSLHVSQAGAAFLAPDIQTDFKGTKLFTPNPYMAYARTSQFIQELRGDVLDLEAGVHPSASVHQTALIDPTAAIGASVVVGAKSQIGAFAVIGAGTVIGREVEIGERTKLGAHVCIYDQVKIGRRCRIQAQTTIGSDGFGYAPSASGWVSIAQLGSVAIGDDVHIGANTSIDRGALQDTIIEDQVIIDNQVQIAHNVVVGRRSAIAGCVGIAGSTRIGKNCTLAGAAGVAGHLIIADGVHIGMQAQVTKSISVPGHYGSGTGLYPLNQWRRLVGRLRRLVR